MERSAKSTTEADNNATYTNRLPMGSVPTHFVVQDDTARHMFGKLLCIRLDRGEIRARQHSRRVPDVRERREMYEQADFTPGR